MGRVPGHRSPVCDGVTGRRTSFISALQVAAPIVTTTLPDQRDFDDTTAFVASDVRSPREFVELALALASDPDRRRDLAARARSLFAENLSWATLGAQHLAVYQRAAA